MSDRGDQSEMARDLGKRCDVHNEWGKGLEPQRARYPAFLRWAPTRYRRPIPRPLQLSTFPGARLGPFPGRSWSVPTAVAGGEDLGGRVS